MFSSFRSTIIKLSKKLSNNLYSKKSFYKKLNYSFISTGTVPVIILKVTFSRGQSRLKIAASEELRLRNTI